MSNCVCQGEDRDNYICPKCGKCYACEHEKWFDPYGVDMVGTWVCLSKPVEVKSG